MRYAGAEGEVYAHVCKKYGEPMLEDLGGVAKQGIEGISEPKTEKKPVVKVEAGGETHFFKDDFVKRMTL